MKYVKVRRATAMLALSALMSCATPGSRKPAVVGTSAGSGISESVIAAYKARADALLVRGAAIGIISHEPISKKLLLGDVKSETDLFEIGSVSKAFTGIATALILSDKELKEPISKYIRELRKFPAIGNITPYQLATHTSGLVDAYVTPSGAVLQNYDEKQLIRFLKKTKLVSPGKKSYSDIGFATLGLVLSRVEKKSFPEVIQDRLLRPLRMSDTGFMLRHEKPNGLVQGCDVLLNPSSYHPLSTLAGASGGIYSDLKDMLLFLNANVRPDDSLLGQAIKHSHDLGLGWDSDAGAVPTEKNGAMPDGFSSYILFDSTLGNETGVIVLTNNLNISIAMGLGSIALGSDDSSLLPQELNLVDPAIIASISGSYHSADEMFGIEIGPLSGTFLGGIERVGTQSGAVRLFSYNSALLLVDDGAEVTDGIQITGGSGGLPPQIVYKQRQGVDANGKPSFKSIPLQRN